MSNQIFPLEFVNNMVILGGGGVGQSITLITQGTPGVGQSITFDLAGEMRGPKRGVKVFPDTGLFWWTVSFQ